MVPFGDVGYLRVGEAVGFRERARNILHNKRINQNVTWRSKSNIVKMDALNYNGS